MRVNNGDRAFLRRGFDLITDRALRGVGRGNGAWGNGVGPPVTKTVNWITTETIEQGLAEDNHAGSDYCYYFGLSVTFFSAMSRADVVTGWS